MNLHSIPLPVLLVIALAGCGNPGPDAKNESMDPAPACASFVDAYARCQSKLGAPNAATERVAATRGDLERKMSAATTDVERARVAEKCARGIQQLRTVCP